MSPRPDDRDEAPGPPPAGEAAGFLGDLLVGQADLAIRGPADPDRNPGQLHDANRPRFTILDVETSGFRHDGSNSSLSLARRPILHARSTNRSVPPASHRFHVPPSALAEIATAGSSTVQCRMDHRLNPTAAPIKPCASARSAEPTRLRHDGRRQTDHRPASGQQRDPGPARLDGASQQAAHRGPGGHVLRLEVRVDRSETCRTPCRRPGSPRGSAGTRPRVGAWPPRRPAGPAAGPRDISARPATLAAPRPSDASEEHGQADRRPSARRASRRPAGRPGPSPRRTAGRTRARPSSRPGMPRPPARWPSARQGCPSPECPSRSPRLSRLPRGERTCSRIASPTGRAIEPIASSGARARPSSSPAGTDDRGPARSSRWPDGHLGPARSRRRKAAGAGESSRSSSVGPQAGARPGSMKPNKPSESPPICTIPSAVFSRKIASTLPSSQ